MSNEMAQVQVNETAQAEGLASFTTDEVLRPSSPSPSRMELPRTPEKLHINQVPTCELESTKQKPSHESTFLFTDPEYRENEAGNVFDEAGTERAVFRQGTPFVSGGMCIQRS
jgi:hypothetical protein